MEILSDTTAQNDRGLKKQLYQDVFRTPDYFWFDPYTLEFVGFRIKYDRYEEIAPNQQGWRWSGQLQLYLGIAEDKLRFFTSEGELVSTPEEAEAKERQRAEQAEAQVEQLRRRLQALRVGPNEAE